MSQEITQLHNEVLEFLLEKRTENNELYFTLRATDSEKLRLGYWFWGNDSTHLFFSFWQGTVKGLPSVCFVLDHKHNLTLYLYSEENEHSYSFFEKLSKILGNFQQRKKRNQEEGANGKENRGVWVRKYHKGTWQENLSEFIATEKQKVDILLDFMEGKEVGVFKAIRKKDFEKKLTQINKIKELPQQQEQKIYFPLRLQKITLTNIGHFSSLSLDLSKRVTVLIGENGSGKSTILRAIALGLVGVNALNTPDISYLEEEKLKKLLKITSIAKQRNFATTGSIMLDYQIDKPYQNEIEFRLINNEIVVNDLGEDVTSKTLVSERELYDFCIGFPQGGNKSLQKSFSEISSPDIVDLLPLIANEMPNKIKDLEEWLEFQHGIYIAATLRQEKHIAQNAREQINTVFGIISKIVSGDADSIRFKDVLITNDSKSVIIVTPQAPEGISLDLLSQGYNNLFYWVGGIVSRIYQVYHYYSEKYPNRNTDKVQEISGIVLIDEIDTYLHPKWQRNILKVLVEEFPKLQFVVTTHSPLVIGHLALWKNSNVFKIQNNEAVPKTHFYGRNPIDLLLEFYGVETRPKEIQEKIDNLYYAFEEENLDEAKQILAELTEILGSDDSIVSEFTASITLLEEIQ